MPTKQPTSLRRTVAITALLLVIGAMGCRRAEQFDADIIWAQANHLTTAQSDSIQSVLSDLFGTPDAPKLPNGNEVAQLLELPRLEQASGKVVSKEVGITQGLYGRHCARCHGITGNGRGPTALYQSPYPRDFRWGIFKWKSTIRAAKPIDDDLLHTLTYGVAGTSMPSFALLTEEERITLVQYVKYLAIRGELEQELIGYVAEELDIKELLDGDDPEITALLGQIVSEWQYAESDILEIPTEALSTGSFDRGKVLYASEQAGCIKCHGKEGLGEGVSDTDFDVWNKRRFDLLSDADKDLANLLEKDLPIRTSVGKQLINSSLRGKADSANLYRRIHQGINGSPMPAVGTVADYDQGALNDQEIVDLVAYVATLVNLPEAEEGGDEQ